MGAFPAIEAIFAPFVSAWRYLPAPSFIPILLMWFGTGEAPKLALLFIGVIFFLITLIMDQPEDFKILPGMAGRTRGRVPQELAPEMNTLRVPLSAVFTPDQKTESGTYVWIVDEAANTVSQRSVTTGELDRSGIQIRDGLEAGELVVVSGASFLTEGQAVRPVERGS